jgi:hypothetical protein
LPERRARQKVKDFSCIDQFFNPLTFRESMPDIEINLCMKSQHLNRFSFSLQHDRNPIDNDGKAIPLDLFTFQPDTGEIE